VYNAAGPAFASVLLEFVNTDATMVPGVKVETGSMARLKAAPFHRATRGDWAQSEDTKKIFTPGVDSRKYLLV
jgi:hypothetical protein